MTHVVLQNCCLDGTCIPVCPVNCIHPTSAEGGYAATEMLFIDPHVCIDCGACADVCPVGAISSDYDLSQRDLRFRDVNADYFEQPGARDYIPRREQDSFAPSIAGNGRTLRVAIVGTGPAACYAAADLLARTSPGVKIDMFERLLVPGGLARFGVAPDHLTTRAMVDQFERVFDDDRVKVHFGVEIGRDIAPSDLSASYHAVIYAVGAKADRPLGIAGESLPGSHSAAEFVGWYNGHPDFAASSFDLSAERAIIIGNGNVALDVARILAQDPEGLRRSDIAEHALGALRTSRLREIVVIGRRDPLHAAFTLSELLGLQDRDDFALWTDFPLDLCSQLLESGAARAAGWTARRKLGVIADLPRQSPATGRSIRLSFLRSPEAVLGEYRTIALRQGINRFHLDDDAGSIVVQPTGARVVEDAGLVVRAAGFRGEEIAGLTFDESRGTIPNADGRVLDPIAGTVMPGVYVTGWIKRGPSGTMGTNKACARETITALLDDVAGARLSEPDAACVPLAIPRHCTVSEWRAIDHHERDLGRRSGRPRVKLVEVGDMLRAAGRDAEWLTCVK